MNTLDTIKELLTLGWPAIVLIMIIVVWKRHVEMTDKYIKFLEDRLAICDDIHINSDAFTASNMYQNPRERSNPDNKTD